MNLNQNHDRREFMQQAGAASLLSFALPKNFERSIVAANDQIRIGLIGCGGRGKDLLGSFERINDVKLVACCDPDQSRMDSVAKDRPDVSKFVDYRKLLDQDNIDAVVIASTNHWHAAQAIHALQAGKDVYVEKPVTFSVDQGKSLVAAAEKYGRIIQTGTQNRSDTGLVEAFKMIHEGQLGSIQSIRGLCYRNRSSIGKRDQPLQIPANIDYNLWLGGSQDLPIMRPKLHYDWHWDFNTGNGDIGNQAPHEFDLITWLKGNDPFKGTVQCFGHRFGWNDAGNTPNMQTFWYDWDGVPVIFEVNNLWVHPEQNKTVSYRGVGVGVIVQCEEGTYLGGRGGGRIVAPDGETVVQRFRGDSGATHYRNFIDAVRTRDASVLRAPIIPSVISAGLPHLANISYRSGTETRRSELLEQVPEKIAEVIRRQESQMQAWGIDTEHETPYVLGSVVELDADGEVRGNDRALELANPSYRQPFEFPRQV